MFGYPSDLERADILFTSLLVQMARGLAAEPVPAVGGGAKAWRRSWMLGYASAVVARVRAAEQAAVANASAPGGRRGRAVDRARARRPGLTVRHQAQQAYPRTRKSRVTYSGSGYQAGYREGQKADIGGAKVRSRSGAAIAR